jgi:carboxymethylenebutenolidase
LHTETLTLARDGQRAFEGCLARPAAAGRHPGIIIYTEMWGITEARRQLARDFAARGWVALVPDIFWRAEHTGMQAEDDAGRARAMQRLEAYDYERGRADLAAAAHALRASAHCSGKVAALGLCVGGRLAFLAAAGGLVDGAVSLYGTGIINHLAEIDHVRCPLQLHYGMQDPFIPAEEVGQIAARAAAHPNIEIFRYPGMGHGFMNPARPYFSAQTVELVNSRIVKLLSTLTSHT